VRTPARRPSNWTRAGSLLALGLAAAVVASGAGARPPGVLVRLLDHTQRKHPNALWHVVHDLCVTDMRASGHPAPCAQVDLSGGFALIKDMGHQTQYLLIPTARITGIESPRLQDPDAPNYWRDAWQARALVEQALGRELPRPDIGLAVNSIPGRTQNQLHIHIDCVRPDVITFLADHQKEIGSRWSILTKPLDGWRYHVRWVAGEDLGDHDPFKLLARTDPAARSDMGDETLAVIGAVRPDGSPGFILLSAQGGGDNDDAAVAERLLDHSCRVAQADAATVRP